MNIELSMDAIQQSVASKIEEAVAKAVASYGVQRAIEEKISDEATMGVVGQSVEDAVRSLDTSTLTTALAAEIQRAMTSAIVLVVEDAMCEIVMRLRKVPEYDDVKRAAARESILYTMRGGR